MKSLIKHLLIGAFVTLFLVLTIHEFSRLPPLITPFTIVFTVVGAAVVSFIAEQLNKRLS